MTDISPQWRLKIMTEVFGSVGVGWKWTIEKVWTEPGPAGEVMAFAMVHVWIRDQTDVWSVAIPGIGGSALIAKESGGLRANDEGYKMAVTDALSVALKSLGVASEIYEGKWDGSKYKDSGAGATNGLTPPKAREPHPPSEAETPRAVPVLTLEGDLSPEEQYGRLITTAERRSLMGLVSAHGVTKPHLKAWCKEQYGIDSGKDLRLGMLAQLGTWVGAHTKGQD
jgi:hypothetical protein